MIFLIIILHALNVPRSESNGFGIKAIVFEIKEFGHYKIKNS